MKLYLNDECEGIEFELDVINSFGGEVDYADSPIFDSYALQLGNLILFDFSPEDYKELGLAIINHLCANGHRFEIIKTQDGQEIRSI